MRGKKKKSQLTRRKAVEDKREWQSISRQILEVQELTRETNVEGKTEEAVRSKENI